MGPGLRRGDLTIALMGPGLRRGDLTTALMGPGLRRGDVLHSRSGNQLPPTKKRLAQKV